VSFKRSAGIAGLVNAALDGGPLGRASHPAAISPCNNALPGQILRTGERQTSMTPTESKPIKRRLQTLVRVVGLAIVFAGAVTACGWFITGTNSPINHGMTADAHKNDFVFFWVIANLPAAVLFMNLFGSQRSEATYFLCVFIQWFLAGLVLAGLWASGHNIRKRAAATPPRQGD
jgi:hypothetical protein